MVDSTATYTTMLLHVLNLLLIILGSNSTTIFNYIQGFKAACLFDPVKILLRLMAEPSIFMYNKYKIPFLSQLTLDKENTLKNKSQHSCSANVSKVNLLQLLSDSRDTNSSENT